VKEQHQIGYFFIVFASIIIVIAGVKAAFVVIVPFLLSLFLAIILHPFYNFFSRYNVPDSISLTIVLVTFIALGLGVAKLVGTSLYSFNANIETYTTKLLIYYADIASFLEEFGIAISRDDIAGVFNSKEIMSFATKAMQSMGGIFSDGFVVFFSVIFMLLESNNFSYKLSSIFRDKTSLKHLDKILSQIKNYMVLKAVISAFTGFIIYIALWFIGVDYPFLWAMIAFLFNFIPNIGSIIAAFPVVLLTLVQLGPLSAAAVVVVYVVVNIVIGSIIEPKVMGKGLGLSSLVVFLSLIFWGWLLGIVGMFLSIPLTIMLKIMFYNNKNTRWIATLLGTGEAKKPTRFDYVRVKNFLG